MPSDIFIQDLHSLTTRLELGVLVDAGDIARMVRGLVDRELRPGGPYALLGTGVIDIETTALATRFVAALAAPTKPVMRVADHGAEQVLVEIHRAAERRLAPLPQWIAVDAHRVIERTIAGNVDQQMSLMSYYVHQALGGNAADTRTLGELGLANIFFWTAFILYDDFWDEDEAADPKLLPIANLFARHYVDYFSALPLTGFRQFFHASMDALDAANGWETRVCRMQRMGNIIHIPDILPHYGSYTTKFYPAAGHVAGPVALFAQNGFDPRSPETESLLAYFRHYLVAMQLNDDAHDWKEDLGRGHISTAVSVLLREWHAQHPHSSTIDLQADMPELEQLFWFKALDQLCESIHEHCRQARAALAACTPIVTPAPLLRYIEQNERAAAAALHERAVGDALISAFA